jgi:hypothetical protein
MKSARVTLDNWTSTVVKIWGMKGACRQTYDGAPRMRIVEVPSPIESGGNEGKWLI